MKYFDIEKVIEVVPEATTYLVVGAGGVGKSFSGKLYVAREAIKKGRLLVYVGRVKEDTKRVYIEQFFDDILTYNEKLQKIPIEQYLPKDKIFGSYCVTAKAGIITLCGLGVDGKVVPICKLGCTTSVWEAERFKRGTYPDYYNILFDEFITNKYYINGEGEPDELDKIIQTVARGRKKVKVFMFGNPDNEIDMCPYLIKHNIEYDNLAPNTVYPLNDNVVFVKVTKDDTSEFINKSTVGMFGRKHSSRVTGDIDRPKVIHFTDDILSDFETVVEIVIETNTIALETFSTFRKKIYMYLGIYKGEWAVVMQYHHRPLREGTYFRLYSCFDQSEMIRDFDSEILYGFRMKFPQEADKIVSILNYCFNAKRVFYEDDRIANIYVNLMKL